MSQICSSSFSSVVLMFCILELGGSQLITYKYIGIIAIRHNDLQFGIAQEVSKDVTTS